MGQRSSCIQGQTDWLGPYTKAPKRQDSDIYEQIRKLTAGSNAKDFYELENLFKTQVYSRTSQRSSTMSSKTSSDSSTKDTPNKIEELFYKETHCKDVNFSQEEKENKVPSIKPIIVKKRTCVVHGTVNSEVPPVTPAKPSSTCKVHGHQSVVSVKEMPGNETKQAFQAKQSPPAYRFPPQINHRSTDEQENRDTKSQSEDSESVGDSDINSAFTCPEFLTNLILPADEPETEDILAAVGVQSAKETIQRLEDRAESIVETFGVVLKHLEHGDWSTFCISTSRLCDDIRRVMKDYNIHAESKDLDAVKIKNHITGAMNQLTINILSSNQNSNNEASQSLIPSFKNLGEVLHEMMEYLISKELKVLIDCLHNGSNNFCIRMAVCALAEMSLSGELMCKLIVQEGAILPLLNVCKVRKYNYLRPLALRTLTVICSVQKALEEFEKLFGFDIIMAIMKEEPEEKIACEAVGLIAQILKQWSENNLPLPHKIGHYLSQLVKYLAGTAQKALSPEMFLLSAACLATLSCCSTEATAWLLQHGQEMKLLASNTKQESYV